jgi:uncharacterized protein YebE (UPF0316 family)
MIDLIEIFTLKFLDTAIGALKNIFLIKNMSFLSALANTLSYLFYILMMKQLMTTTTIPVVLTTLAAVFIGQYATQEISDKLDKDKTWKITATPNSKEQGKILADTLKESNLAVKTFPCFNSKKEKVLGVIVFSLSKAESVLIDSIFKDFIIPDKDIDITETKRF